jgi:hypothetical protein
MLRREREREKEKENNKLYLDLDFMKKVVNIKFLFCCQVCGRNKK